MYQDVCYSFIHTPTSDFSSSERLKERTMAVACGAEVGHGLIHYDVCEKVSADLIECCISKRLRNREPALSRYNTMFGTAGGEQLSIIPLVPRNSTS